MTLRSALSIRLGVFRWVEQLLDERRDEIPVCERGEGERDDPRQGERKEDPNSDRGAVLDRNPRQIGSVAAIPIQLGTNKWLDLIRQAAGQRASC